eukprot:TRINITY_DN38018_c0_g1_i1.p1 TRINITY_DN38018_c0_g1~~TRINITY_DN38018_c0_g1_i1.p1  ORF type:complete len:555 (-),score=82.83 TRINITY_DN38018_c0_g1_i1:50-1687(-)
MPWVILACAAVAASAEEPTATVPGLGSLTGSDSQRAEDIAVFRGIPYGKAPTGALRWQVPQAHGPWQSPLDARNFGSRCFGFNPKEIGAESEDCLYLNIATPKANIGSAHRLPVMVYIHGGAFTSGASNHNELDALVLRSNLSVVVVTLNYRLSIFGFLAANPLDSRSPDRGTGNYGIDDQRLALRWVRDHISAFGGDGNHVTIFGESAGGHSILNHLTQSQSFGLYDKAIIESGDYFGSRELSTAKKDFESVLNSTRCENLDCLIQVSPEKLVEVAIGIEQWGPVIDGVSLQHSPRDLLALGKFNRVPVIIGSNRDEAALWTAEEGGAGFVAPNLTEEQFDALLARYPYLSPSGAAHLKKLYDSSSYEYPEELGKFSRWWWAVMRIDTDGGSPPGDSLGHCSVRRAARALASGGAPSVFVYMFALPSIEPLRDVNEGTILPGTGSGVLVPHASEVPFAFAMTDRLNVSDAETKVAWAMAGLWISFAKSGEPSDPSVPRWPRFNESNDAVLQLAGDMSVRQHLRKSACDFWDELVLPGSSDAVFV